MKQPPDCSYWQGFRFPLDLVASTAARLLDGENYQDAAKRALKLLEACDAELVSDAVANDPVAHMVEALGGNGANFVKGIKIKVSREVDHQPGPASSQAEESNSGLSQAAAEVPVTLPRRELPASMPFQRMLKHVTGKDGVQARKAYADFLRWHMRVEKSPDRIRFFAGDFNPDGSRRTREEEVAAEESQWLAKVAEVAEPTAGEVDARKKTEAARPFTRDEAEHLARWFTRWKARRASETAAEKGRKGGRGKKKG